MITAILERRLVEALGGEINVRPPHIEGSTVLLRGVAFMTVNLSSRGKDL
jgi:signal transduction histidine kinase